jgi:hypothetical protein
MPVPVWGLRAALCRPGSTQPSRARGAIVGAAIYPRGGSAASRPRLGLKPGGRTERNSLPSNHGVRWNPITAIALPLASSLHPPRVPL